MENSDMKDLNENKNISRTDEKLDAAVAAIFVIVAVVGVVFWLSGMSY